MTDPYDPLVLARRIASLAAERRAADVVLLDVRELVDYTDFFLLASGQSSRQNVSIAEHVVKTLKAEKRYALSKAGLESGSWICLDLGSVVVHVFDPETRVRYDLELLWADAPRVPLDEPAHEPAAAPAAPSEAAVAEPAPKRRRRSVRAAAVADADAENAPESERPSEPAAESAPRDDMPAARPKRAKAKASATDASAPRAPKAPAPRKRWPADEKKR